MFHEFEQLQLYYTSVEDILGNIFRYFGIYHFDHFSGQAYHLIAGATAYYNTCGGFWGMQPMRPHRAPL